jgi:hypothetical protein
MTGKQRKPKTVPAPTFDTCTFLEESINPLFDSTRVLLRRVFFLNTENTRYVSVGFYPAQNYEPLVEFGGAKIAPLLLNEKQVTTMAVHLPRLVKEVCSAARFKVKVDDTFTLSTASDNNVARFTLGGQRIQFKVADVRRLETIFYIVQNQLVHYKTALPDLKSYVAQVIGSTEFVAPTSIMSVNISYPQLYEELKSNVY